MEIRYRCSLDDYLEAQSCESKSVAYYLYWIFSALFLLWGIYQAVTAGFAQAFGKFLMAGLCLVWPLAIRPIAIRSSFGKVPHFVMETRMVVGGDGLQIENPAGRSENQWTAYTRFKETPNLLLLYTGVGTFEVIPKRAFSESELAQFTELLTRHVHRAPARRDAPHL